MVGNTHHTLVVAGILLSVCSGLYNHVCLSVCLPVCFVFSATDVIDSTHGAIYPRQPGFHAPRQNNLVQEPSYPRQPVFVPNNTVESGEPREEVIDHGYAPTASENPANNHIQVGAISHTVVEAPMQPLNHMV